MNPIGSSTTTRVLRLGVVPSANFSLAGGTAQTQVSAQSSSASATLQSMGVANSQIVRATRLTIAVNPASSVVAPVVSAGTDVFTARATADAAGSVLLKKLVFNVSVASTAATPLNFTLRANGTKLTNGTDVDCLYATGAGLTCIFTGTNADGYSIAAGSTVEFKITVDTTAITVGTAGSISFNMTQLSTSSSPVDYATAAAMSSSAVQYNRCATSHSLTTMDWFTDAGMTIDSSSQTFYRN